jgi:hypothetical protein
MEQTNMGAQAAPATAARPTFLTVLCILTWISSGLLFLLFLTATVAFGVVGGMLSKVGMGAIGGAGAAAFGGFALTYGLMFTGALMMWKVKKMGFYIYVAGNVINLALPFVFGMPFDIMGTAIVAIFIALYAINLKHLK